MAAETFEQRLGKRVRAAREKAGMSQMDVVLKNGGSLSHLQKIERGVLDPRVSTMAKLAKLFGCTIDELVGKL
jgi:transcriptional regulator with XRE-family HTH domain